MRKSKREKEKEREEAKRKEEEELAAKTYAEYLDTFEGTGARHGGTGGASKGGSGFVKAGEGGTYDPARGVQPQKAGFAQAFDEDTTVGVSSLKDFLLPRLCSLTLNVASRIPAGGAKAEGQARHGCVLAGN